MASRRHQPPLAGWQRFHRFHRLAAMVVACATALFVLALPDTQVGAASATTKRGVRSAVPKKAARVVRRTTTKPRKSSKTPVTVALLPSTIPPSTVIAPSTGTAPSIVTPTSTVTPTAPTTLAPVANVPLPTPAEYLADALQFIERYWVRRRSVDVKAITDRARAAGSSARTLADLYPVLRQTVKELGDGHSAFLEPTAARSLLEGTSTGFGLRVYPPDVIFVVPGSPADVAGIRTLDRIVSFNGKPFAATSATERAVDTAVIRVVRPQIGELEFSVRRGELTTAERPTARALDARIGYLDLPGSTGKPENEQAFASAGVAVVNSVEQQISPCGWVLDLRRNSGGFPFSMMSALEPFFPEQSIGGFVYGDDKREQLRFSAGKVLIDNRVVWTNAAPARLRDPSVPVAVLTSNLTGSAGEIATIAFIGRPGSRSFGTATVGVTSANVGVRLADDSFLMVTHSYDLDRTGKVYDGPINPDEVVLIDWSTFGTTQDPVLNAASTWLAGQPSCAGRTP